MAEADAFDIIIVGGGTAGLVLASRLSEDAALQVLVLEAGLDLPQLPEQLMQAVLTPPANAQLYKTPVDWNFKTVPQVNLGGRELCFPQGKMLGGSSGLNGLSFTASAQAVVEGWAELGNPGWEWPAFSQSLSQTYTVSKASPVVAEQKSISSSNNKGPLQLSYADDYRGGWPQAWADTIESLGFPGAQDALAGQAGAGGLMIPDTVDPAAGIRSYAASAYLPPEVRARANLTVRTGVEVKKVLFEKKAPGGSSSGGDAGGGLDAVVATGVEYYTDPTTTGATETTATARREVIIAAGAFGSPRLLELSGIGDARRLGAQDVVVVVDLPGVGENLQNHPLATVSLEVTDDAPPTKDAFLRAAIRQDDADKVLLGGAMQEYAERRTGPLASSGVTSAAQLPLPGLDTPAGARDLEDVLLPLLLDGQTTGAGGNGGGGDGGGAFAEAHERFVRGILSSPRDEASSGYYILGPAYAAFNPDGTGALPPLEGSEDSYVTVVLMLAHPLSRGSVHVVGGRGDGAAGQTTELAIDPGFLSHPLDLEIMARHLRFIEEGLAATEPLAKWLKPNGKRAVGAPEAGALKDLEVAKKYLKDRAVGAHHFTGSCSMLPRDMGGVVDPLLRVYGTANLRVCDASVIPLTPRANPQATVYGVAEHAATLIKRSLFSP